MSLLILIFRKSHHHVKTANFNKEKEVQIIVTTFFISVALVAVEIFNLSITCYVYQIFLGLNMFTLLQEDT